MWNKNKSKSRSALLNIFEIGDNDHLILLDSHYKAFHWFIMSSKISLVPFKILSTILDWFHVVSFKTNLISNQSKGEWMNPLFAPTLLCEYASELMSSRSKNCQLGLTHTLVLWFFSAVRILTTMYGLRIWYYKLCWLWLILYLHISKVCSVTGLGLCITVGRYSHILMVFTSSTSVPHPRELRVPLMWQDGWMEWVLRYFPLLLLCLFIIRVLKNLKGCMLHICILFYILLTQFHPIFSYHLIPPSAGWKSPMSSIHNSFIVVDPLVFLDFFA